VSNRQLVGAAQPAEAGTRLLIVDDDDDVRGLVVRVLTADGFSVDHAADAPEATRLLSGGQYDLIVLDIMLKDQDGLEFLAGLRKTNDTPVILLTGRGHEADRVLGLRQGADDYMVKPFSPAELSARIDSVLRRTRRSAPEQSDQMVFGSLLIDTSSREVTVEGEKVELTAKEFDLLRYLAGSPRQVFSRNQLLQEVWESSSEWQDSSTVTEHVRRIRRKIDADPDNPRWIRTVRGVGYRFEP
jgi:DNA-binding response OmpR family regulator